MAKYFKCTTNKNPLEYTCGEKIVFTVTPKEKRNDSYCRFAKWELLTDDGKKDEGLSFCDGNNPIVVETVLDKPGFARLTCTAYNENKGIDESFPRIIVSAGADIEKLSYLDTIPDDFGEYWADFKDTVDNFETEVTYKKEITAGIPDGVKCYDIRLSTPEGKPVSASLCVPEAEGKYPIIMRFSGYGISGSDNFPQKDAITMHVNAHGIENHLSGTELEFKYGKELANYGLRDDENASNMTTYWRGVMLRDLMGIKYAKSLPKWDGENLTVSGGSQGAYQSILMASADPDVTFLDISVPWFCNLRAEEFGFMNGWRAKFAEGLRYFDPVAHATRVKCPVKMRIGLGDYCCPPSTTVTLYNTFKTEKTLEIVQGAFHEMQYIPEGEIYYKNYDPQNPTGELKKGIYRNLKGEECEVLGEVYDSVTGNKLAIYKSLADTSKVLSCSAHLFHEFVYTDGKFKKNYNIVK